MKNVKTAAYPVQLFMGMYWAYLGPLPAPVIPHLDVWVRRDGTRSIAVYPPMDCNLLQAQENSVDPAHLQVLHWDPSFRKTRPVNTTRGFTDDVSQLEFYMIEYGIMKKRTYVNGFFDEHPILFPNVLRVQAGTEIRVPIDDKRTVIFEAFFHQSADGSLLPRSGRTARGESGALQATQKRTSPVRAHESRHYPRAGSGHVGDPGPNCRPYDRAPQLFRPRDRAVLEVGVRKHREG